MVGWKPDQKCNNKQQQLILKTMAGKNGHSEEENTAVLEAKEILSANEKASSKRGKGKEAPTQEIELPELDFKQVTFTVKGIAPLIVNKFSEKAKQMMVDKQTKKATKGREAKNPEQQYKDSLYFFPDGKRTGFPAVGFKASMTRAGKLLGLPMTDTRGKFHVLPDNEGNGLIEIKGKYKMRDDMVRLATGVADVRFRAEYQVGWKADVTILYNATWISKEQLAQILKVAGFSCGIGEWRPEKSNSGSFGLFDVV